MRPALTLGILAICLWTAAPPVCGVEQADVRGGTFFEAEGYDSRHPLEEGFAGLVTDESASDGTAVYRFHKGCVTYKFQTAKEAAYTVWMRYGAPGDTPMNVAVDPADITKLSAIHVPGTGGCVGFGVWQWAPIWSGRLTAGDHVLAVGSGALRPDCFFITDAALQRPDDKLLAEVAWPAGPRLPELRHERVIAQHPRWLQDHLRVCYAHCEWNRDVTVEAWCRLAAEKGANVICSAGTFPCGILDGKLCVLPADVKELPAGYKADYAWVKEYADAAHRFGLKYLCYVNSNDYFDPLLREHPEWRQVRPDGEPQTTWGCWNSPYRRAFIERLVKVAQEAKLDGIFIDMGFTAPPTGCHSKYCIQAFKDRFGVDPPRRPRLKDPLYQRWLDFQSWTREEWLLELTEALHRVNPEFAVLANQTRGWIFDITGGSFLTTRAGRCVDGLAEEIGWETEHPWNRPWAWPLEGPWQNLFLRSRTWPGYAMMWHLTYNMPESELRAQAFTMLANGVAPSVTAGGNWELMSRVWKHIQGCEPWTCGAERVPWLAVHFSEDTLAWYGNANGREATDAYIKNVFGVFQAALEAHVPVEVITDDDLASPEKLRRYAVVALPNSACLSDEQASALKEYVEQGGGLFATFQSGMFDGFGAPRTRPALQPVLGTEQGKADYGIAWSVRLTDLSHPILQSPDIAASRSWGQGRIEAGPVGALYQGPPSRKIGVVQSPYKPDHALALLPMSGAEQRYKGGLKPEKGFAYYGLLARELGKGKVVYSPADLGQAYFCFNHPLGRALLVEAMRWAASQRPPLRVEAPLAVETVLYRKDKALIVHLLNDISSFGRSAAPNPEAFGGFRSEVIPIHDIRVGLPGAFTQVLAEPDGSSLNPVERDGVTWVTLPLLEQHAMIVAR